MKTIYWDEHQAELKPSVATVGFFDGVHRGHVHLLETVIREARKNGDANAVVFTFEEHPRKVLCADYRPQLLTTLDEKLLLLSKTGIDMCVVMRFDKNLASMYARDFMKTILHDRFNVKHLVVGYDHHFGHGRKESFEDYLSYGNEIGMSVQKDVVFTSGEMKISSSAIRSLIAEGDISAANKSLGHNYTIGGRVVRGYGKGRTLGFPTANIELADRDKLVPRSGVYAVRVNVCGDLSVYGGMMNIGNCPTMGEHEATLEVHIFNFEGDIYDKNISVEFVSRLRNECRFDSIDSLSAQLAIDRQTAEGVLNMF